MKNREILFRGKQVNNGEWIEGNLVMVCNGETLERYPHIVISYNYDTFDWNKVVPETVGQFTSLTDKNGNKIFEGDKCLFEIKNIGKWNAECYYSYGCFFFKVEGQKNPFPLYEYEFRNDINIEIVGNIHDNPELL